MGKIAVGGEKITPVFIHGEIYYDIEYPTRTSPPRRGDSNVNRVVEEDEEEEKKKGKEEEERGLYEKEEGKIKKREKKKK